MEIKSMVVTGAEFFIQRHKYLFDALSQHLNQLDYISSAKKTFTDRVELSAKLIHYGLIYIVSPSQLSASERFSKRLIIENFNKSESAFITKSLQTEQKIRELNYRPDVIFQVFSLAAPLWKKFDIPYVYYLDYTMALAKQNYPAWTPFSSREYDSFIACEHSAYKKAHHLFPMSQLVKSSLIDHYGISPKKITVVGSAGNFSEPYEGEKLFGSKQILFNGSDFTRKGGELVLAAFKQIKHKIPEAKLVIVGTKLPFNESGIHSLGHISSPTEMRKLFLNSDLVVAPAHCDPFPGFLIEALNYGIPCVVQNRDGMPEIIDNTVNGIVIKQPSPDMLANEIIKLLNDVKQLEVMSQNARNKVKTKLNWNTIATNIWQTLSAT
jgi:glycosyltransferase involved in cell wall biosynthesis